LWKKKPYKFSVFLAKFHLAHSRNGLNSLPEGTYKIFEQKKPTQQSFTHFQIFKPTNQSIQGQISTKNIKTQSNFKNSKIINFHGKFPQYPFPNKTNCHSFPVSAQIFEYFDVIILRSHEITFQIKNHGMSSLIRKSRKLKTDFSHLIYANNSFQLHILTFL
jgi:hypothetical protein